MSTPNTTETARLATLGLIYDWKSKAAWKRYAAAMADGEDDNEAISLRREAVTFETCSGHLEQSLKGLLK